ncbi:MAG: hypothetical protein HQ510_08875 [Candidatus Marinimicrobia bacterium]|nr:hypothetical protein [Candidatus Neomarinimicrobiota bacterium]
MFRNSQHSFLLFIVAGTFLLKPLFAVGEAGAIFLLIAPSPTMNAMGGIGVSLPSYDIYSSYYNPANPALPLGVSYQKSKYNTAWLPSLASNLVLDNKVETAGIRFKKSNLFFSFSKHETILDLGEQTRTDEYGNIIGVYNFEMGVTATSYSVGMKFTRIPLMIAVGRTDKKAKQILIDTEAGQSASDNDFYDWGYLVSFPLLLKHYRTSGISLNLIPSVGYSQSNIGGDIMFFDDLQSDPSPRFARFGISGILELKSAKGKNLLSLSYAHEAGDLLVELFQDDDEVWRHQYQNGLGDINIKRHIMSGSADESVTLYQGSEIGIMNAFFVRKGHMIDTDGQVDIYTSGYGYNLAGLFSLFSILTEDPSFLKMSEYFNIRYNYALESSSEVFSPRNGTYYKEVALSLNNPQKLLSFMGKDNVSWFGSYLMSNLWYQSNKSAYSSLPGFDIGVEVSNLFERTNLVTGFRFARFGFAMKDMDYFFDNTISIDFHLNYFRAYLAKPLTVGLSQLLLGAELGYLLTIDSETTICDPDGECQSATASISGSDWQHDFNGNYEDAGLFANLRIPMGSLLSLDIQYYHGFTNVFAPVNAQNQSLRIGVCIRN